MTDTFDAVLAEGRNVIRDQCGDGLERAAFTDLLDRLAAAHAAEVAEIEAQRDAAFAMSKCECASDECCMNLVRANARAEAAERDARRYRWLRDRIAPEELTDEVVALFAIRTVGPIANRPADDDCLDDVDAAIDAAIATTEQAPERAGRE